MVTKVERLAFPVHEAASRAGCDVYSLLSLAVKNGVQIFTFLPDSTWAVSIDRRYVAGELLTGMISASILLWSRATSVPCISGFLLDQADCEQIVLQSRSSRTFFEWGVVIAGKESPVTVRSSDDHLWSLCLPSPSEETDASAGDAMNGDFKLPDLLPDGPWSMGPHPAYMIPQLAFAAYPTGLQVVPDQAELRFPRPAAIVLHPDRLFLLRDGMDQLGLLSVSSDRSQEGRNLVAETEREEEALSHGMLTGQAGVISTASSKDEPNGRAGLPRDVQFPGIDVQDYWPYWLKGFIKVASKEWEKWRKDVEAVQTSEDRKRFERALLRLNNDHNGRTLEVSEARSCVTMLSPLWARHWGGKEDRPNSPATPVTGELLEMIAAAEAIKEFNENSGKKLLRKDIKAWLERALYHSFSQTQLKIAADLLYDAPKKSGKNKAKKTIKKQ